MNYKRLSLVSLALSGLIIVFPISFQVKAETSPALFFSEIDKSASFFSSHIVNAKYANQKFKSLPESQMKSLMPLVDLPALSTGVSSHSVDTGKPGNSATLRTSSRAYGNSKLPFTSSRVFGGTSILNPAQADPYRKTGRLQIAFGNSNTYTHSCSASLIGKSLLLTAGHCVYDREKGLFGGLARKVKFVPAKDNINEPYRSFEGTNFLMSGNYYLGTDTCLIHPITRKKMGCIPTLR